jgi:hypothetical protein
MSVRLFTVLATLAGLLGPALACKAQQSSTASPAGAASTSPSAAQPASGAAAAPSENELLVSGSGYALEDPSAGGGAGSLTYLHDFSSGVLGVAGEYDTLANAHWEFGSLTGALNFGSPADKWTLYAEGHEGIGEVGTYFGLRRFDYNVEAAGLDAAFGGKVILQLDSHQYDIDTAHGNLPKAGVGVLWTPHLETTVSFAHSVSGNLGTQLTMLRLDYFGPISWVLGGATGFASPPVLNIVTGTLGPAPTYREGFLGFTKTFRRVDWGILADYIKLGEVKRYTLTMTWTLHL